MERLRLHIPERRSTDAPAPNATLFVGARIIVIDERNLPARLVRLLPAAYGTANHPDRNAGAWAAFVATADAMGLLYPWGPPATERERQDAILRHHERHLAGHRLFIG